MSRFKQRVLAIFPDSSTISYSLSKLVLPDGSTISIPTKHRILCKFRVFSRLFRSEPRCGTFLSDDIFVITHQQKLWFISLSESKIIKTKNLRDGFSNVLNFCSLRQYGQNIVYFGDYGKNLSSRSINIYRLDESQTCEVCYSFPASSIKHVHNIIFDKYRNRFFIFTGDFEEKAGIYVANKDFSEVKPFLLGKQKYRAVIGKVLKDGLLYATDAVMEDNHLYYTPFTDNTPKPIMPLNGSVIYGLAIDGGLVFSTTVEPRPSVSSKIISLLDNRRGLGIKSKYIDVFLVRENLACEKLKSYKKDWLPMRLFQYGAVYYPALYDEQAQLKTIPINPISVEQYDGLIDYIKFQE